MTASLPRSTSRNVRSEGDTSSESSVEGMNQDSVEAPNDGSVVTPDGTVQKKPPPVSATVAYIVRAVTPRNLRAPGGNGRGHVPARALRAHRRRHTHGIGEGIRSPMSSETDQTSDLAAQGGRDVRFAPQILAEAGDDFAHRAAGLHRRCLRSLSQSLRRRRAAAARRGKGTIRHGRRPRRSAAARLHDNGRQVAAAAPPEGCRSALPQNAVRLRRQALLQPPRYRSESRRSRRPADGAPRAHRLRRHRR